MTDSGPLTHFDDAGQARIVNISAKPDSERIATAQGRISMTAEALEAIRSNSLAKGDAIATARIAGIMAAKNTAQVIPLCHPLALRGVTVDFEFAANTISVSATVRTIGPTGVEMEALNAVSVALLTLYDMAKALDKSMIISDICLAEKRGGKSGDWQRHPAG